MNYKALGQQIRHQRQIKYLTQSDLAVKAHISTSFLGHIERGTRKASLETVINIANSLDIGVDPLLRDSLSYHQKLDQIEIQEIEPRKRKVLAKILEVIEESELSL